jgi:glycosyltransferase involved in cell wall biosynthesis
VISEAIVAGAPVIASRIDGNVGLLGEDYPGYFEAGDAKGLARLLETAEANAVFLAELKSRCVRRARLFAPERERKTWERLLEELSIDHLH